MNKMTEQERMGLLTLVQEIEEGKNAHASVSRTFARPVEKGPMQLELA
jgi:hypothetical protein